LWLYAPPFHQAAKALAGALQLDSTPFAGYDASPVVCLRKGSLPLSVPGYKKQDPISTSPIATAPLCVFVDIVQRPCGLHW
jgi:hypothetical protein